MSMCLNTYVQAIGNPSKDMDTIFLYSLLSRLLPIVIILKAFVETFSVKYRDVLN